MSDELNPYPGNLKHHKVDEATANHLRIIANQAELIQRLVNDVAELQYLFASSVGCLTKCGDETLNAASAAGFKPSEQ